MSKSYFKIVREAENDKSSIITTNEELALRWVGEPNVKVFEVVTTEREVFADKPVSAGWD
jgi:hypothetical protein